MDWKQLLVSITRSVDQELRLRNEYLASENRILRNQISGRVQLRDNDRRGLAEIGKKLGKKALNEIATVATSPCASPPACTIASMRRTRAASSR